MTEIHKTMMNRQINHLRGCPGVIIFAKKNNGKKSSRFAGKDDRTGIA